MKKILFLGPPGAGKGTQGKLLEKDGFKIIGTGDLIRKSHDPKIIKYRNIDYKKGKLLADKLIFNLIEREISKLPKKIKGYILDGAVRTLPQAKYAKTHKLVDEVFYFDVSQKIATKRILTGNRGRSDDNIISIKERFIEYKNKTIPILNYLKQSFEYHKIDAGKSIKEVNKKVIKILNFQD